MIIARGNVVSEARVVLLAPPEPFLTSSGTCPTTDRFSIQLTDIIATVPTARKE